MVTVPPSAVASTSATCSADGSLMRSNPSDMTRGRASSRNPASESPPFAAIEAAASAADHPMPATWPRQRWPCPLAPRSAKVTAHSGLAARNPYTPRP